MSVARSKQMVAHLQQQHCTSMWLAEKQWVNLFVHVVDEYENTPYKNESHASLLAHYKKEVNPNVQVVVVCIGGGNQDFWDEMELESIEYQVVCIDEHRPDLAKYDRLLGQLVKCSVDREVEGDDDFILV